MNMGDNIVILVLISLQNLWAVRLSLQNEFHASVENQKCL